MCEIVTTSASTYSLCRVGESVLYIAYCLAYREVGAISTYMYIGI